MERGNRLVDEARLADPGLPHHRHDGAVSGGDELGDRLQQGAFGDAPDERDLGAAPTVRRRRHGADCEPRVLDLLPPPQLGWCVLLEADRVGAEHARRVADEHPAFGRQPLQPRGDVDDVTHRRVVGARERADENLTRVDPDPQLDVGDGRLLGDEPPQRRVHLESGAHRAFGVVLVRDRRAEQRHDRVTEHLVDPPAEALDIGHQAFERGVDESFDLFRVTELGEGRESHHVGEQDGDDTPALGGGDRQRMPAGGAETGTFRHRTSAGRARHQPASVRHAGRWNDERKHDPSVNRALRGSDDTADNTPRSGQHAGSPGLNRTKPSA